MIIVASFTALWYFTSSKNAVAIQHVVEQVLRGGSIVDGNSITLPSPMEIMTILSFFQLLIGLCIAYPICFFLQHKLKKKTKKAEIENASAKKKTGGVVLIGSLHFAGCICTNLGFAFGSASLVQIIKLLEPVETLIFTVIVTKSLSSVTVRKSLSTCVIILGTSILLMQKNNNVFINSQAVAFALCSGMCMAMRNTVLKKLKHPNSPEQDQKQTSGWHVAALDGTQQFIQITRTAFAVSVIFAVAVTGVHSTSEKMTSVTILILSSGWIGLQSIIYHGLYNIASISVLCLVSAQSHSLLNVGKRVSNVLVAAVVFGENIGIQGIMGLVTAAIGGFVYAANPKMIILFATKIRLYSIPTIVCALLLVVVNFNNFLSTEEVLTSITNAHLTNDMAHSSPHFSVWMFPFPPPTKDPYKIAVDGTLICAYSNACDSYEDHGIKINLRALTKDTYFHNYVSDHAYHKVRHMKDFSYHIHAITMISLLQTRPGSCVSTLGSDKKFCNPQPFDTYDPYKSVGLNSTHYPFPFLLSDRLETTGEQPNLFPDMDQEKFAMWGTEDLPDESAAWINRYNSGEDVQSYASAAWQPFISEIRPKFKALLNYTGYYIGNALVDGVLESSESDFKNMHKISLISIFAAKKVTDKMIPYLQNYTENIAPFGCRSTLTHSNLLATKIKSYFSACLTLTTYMQGATLEGKEQYVHNYNILKPNATKLLHPSNKTMILCVDVNNPSAIPPDIWKRAHFAKADIARDYDTKLALTKMGRYDYSYKLLSIYANQAKVIITSRIHVGLPAAAMGIPVIFVSQSNGKLPGGKEATGRVSGLLDVFHRLDPSAGKNWTFGDLSGFVPPNPGNHLADRYRASFWNRLKKTNFYDDTARLYGMVPMQRLGQLNVATNIQNKFHFVLNIRDLNWQTKRAIEHVFYFHPNSQVYVHSNNIRPSDLEVFVESGYDLVVQEYDIDKLKVDAVLNRMMPVKFADDQTSLYFLLLWKYGGVYISKNTMVVNEIPLSLGDGVFIREHSGNPAMMHVKRHSSEAFALFKGTVEEKEKQNVWTLPVLSMEETSKCIEDEAWALDSLNSTILSSNALAISLHPDIFESTNSIKFKSACFKIVEETCIFCDEIHWDF